MDLKKFHKKDYLITFLKGILLGLVSMGIPGLSASTIAIILGMYVLVVEAISNIFKSKYNLFFFLSYLFGYMVGSAMAAFSVTILFENFPLVTTFVILGMIFGSMPDLIIKLKGGLKKASCWIILILLTCGLVLLNFSFKAGADVEFPTDPNIGYLIRMFFIGIITSTTFIIPGIDFAIVFLSLGIYYSFMNMLTSLLSFGKPGYFETFLPNIKIMGIYILGYFIGVFIFSKLVKKFIYRYKDQTNYASFAFVLAAPIIVIKNCVIDNNAFFTTTGQVIGAFIGGTVALILILYLGIRTRNKKLQKNKNAINESNDIFETNSNEFEEH